MTLQDEVIALIEKHGVERERFGWHRGYMEAMPRLINVESMLDSVDCILTGITNHDDGMVTVDIHPKHTVFQPRTYRGSAIGVIGAIQNAVENAKHGEKSS